MVVNVFKNAINRTTLPAATKTLTKPLAATCKNHT
jgi:hypothetical protein